MRLTFEEVEACLGRPLPRSARVHGAWWSNHFGNAQAKAWMAAGYRVDGFSLDEGWVRFARGQSAPVARPAPKGGRPKAEDAPSRPMSWGPLADLAARRPVFHSEADFQQELAWQLRLSGWEGIRLERPFWFDEPIRLDVFAVRGGERLAIELKYWKRGASFDLDGERYMLKATSANDISRYDFWKDVARLERLVLAGEADRGLAIALSSDGNHWRPPTRECIDVDFRLHEGRVVGPGVLRWADRAGKGTTDGREREIAVGGRYALGWGRYSDHPVVGPLAALIVEVGG